MYQKESHTIDFCEESLNIFVFPTFAVCNLSHISVLFLAYLNGLKHIFSIMKSPFRPV